MDRRILFLASIQWLRDHIAATRPSEFDLLMASGHLRRLLSDGDKSLALIVNREILAKLAFTVGDHYPPPMPDRSKLAMWATPEGLNPNHVTPTHNIEMLQLSLDSSSVAS